MVNLQDLQLTVFQDPSPLGYRTVTNLQDGTISPLAFPNVSIEVRQFFEVNRSSLTIVNIVRAFESSLMRSNRVGRGKGSNRSNP